MWCDNEYEVFMFVFSSSKARAFSENDYGTSWVGRSLFYFFFLFRYRFVFVDC